METNMDIIEMALKKPVRKSLIFLTVQKQILVIWKQNHSITERLRYLRIESRFSSLQLRSLLSRALRIDSVYSVSKSTFGA